MKSSRDQAAALAYGGLGMVLGLALGAAGGMARRSTRWAIKAAVTGLVLGGVAGAGATLSLLPSYHAARASATDEEVTSDLALALRTHGGIWVSVGAAAGLALGLGLGGGARTARATVGGMLGACLAAAIYEFAGALVFPMAETFRPVAVSAGPRLLAHLGVALCVAAVACWAALTCSLRRADPGRAPEPPREMRSPGRLGLRLRLIASRTSFARAHPGRAGRIRSRHDTRPGRGWCRPPGDSRR